MDRQNITPDLLSRVSDLLERQIGEYKSPFSEFLDKDPDSILRTTKQWIADPTSQPANVEWHLLGEIARKRVFQDIDASLEWAEIAILSYEHLSMMATENHQSDLLAAMSMRAQIIIKHGTEKGNFIRDIGTVVQWGAMHEITNEEAWAIFQGNWHNEDVVCQLLYELDKVSILLQLSESGLLKIDENLNNWAKIEDAVARRKFNRGH